MMYLSISKLRIETIKGCKQCYGDSITFIFDKNQIILNIYFVKISAESNNCFC